MQDLQDEIHLHVPSPSPSSKPFLIFFVSGNPGLIEYYRAYLTYLFSFLRDQVPRDLDLHIYGSSLRGFGIGVLGKANDEPRPGTSGNWPYDLEAQKTFLSEKLGAIAAKLRRENDSTALPVILAGHSVGTWLILELASQQHLQTLNNRDAAIKIVGAISLFPTIYDIALSPRGRTATSLVRIPGLLFLVRALAFSVGRLPASVLEKLIKAVTGMPEEGARVTAAFLGSRGGVHQALFLATDELQTIKSEAESSWSDEFWGLTTTAKPPSVQHAAENAAVKRSTAKLFFYWGHNDYWVAEETKARVIATRGDGNGRNASVVMALDEHGIDHAFCLKGKDARIVAERSAGFVMDMVQDL